MTDWQPGDPLYPYVSSVNTVRPIVQVIDDHDCDCQAYPDAAEADAAAARWPEPFPGEDIRMEGIRP